MKKTLLAICIFASVMVCGQVNYPQIWFYANNAPIELKAQDFVDEYDSIYSYLNSLEERNLSKRGKIELLYRRYLIDKTGVIVYIYDSGDSLSIAATEREKFVDYNQADFGTSVKRKDISDKLNRVNLRFRGPVTHIDPMLFRKDIIFISLPLTFGLSYTSSPDIRVDNLAYITGKEVVDNKFLIDQSETLIVVAARGENIVSIPEGVKNIGAGALRGANIDTICIPESVLSIGEKAFDLSTTSCIVINSESMLEIEQNAFGDTPNESLKVYVPKKLVKTYKKQFPKLKKRIFSLNKYVKR